MITLRENEKIHLIKRRHIIVLLLKLTPWVVFFLALIVLAVVSFFALPSWIEGAIEFVSGFLEIRMRYFLPFLFSLSLLIFWTVFFIIITEYYLDCWVVTSERTIHTELQALFRRTISTVPHTQIQDISVDIHGIFPTLFRYGDLHIQTAGKFREFVFKEIPAPYETKDEIFRAQKAFLEGRKTTAFRVALDQHSQKEKERKKEEEV